MKKISAFLKIIFVICIATLILFKWGGSLDLNMDIFNPLVSTKNTYASSHIAVLDRETGEVVFEKNGTSKAYPASLTKIMTTLVALENIEDLAAVTPVDAESYQMMVAKNASMAGFVGNEEVTYRDLLYGTMLPSGGEAANSLAVHVAGSTESFVQMMNEKAAGLGLHDTHFTNPVGLHDDNLYTTASDMAKLLNHALTDGNFRAIFTKENFLTTATLDHPEGILLESTVLSKVNNGIQEDFAILGGKSGTTYEAGQCWATFGVVDGKEYVVIVMGATFEDFSQLNDAQITDTMKVYEKIKLNEY